MKTVTSLVSPKRTLTYFLNKAEKNMTAFFYACFTMFMDERKFYYYELFKYLVH